MNYIFYLLIVVSIIAGAVNGRLSEVVNSILTGAELSVKVAFSLIGIMAFWLGMMKIAQKCGLIEVIAKIIKPVTKRIFNEIPEDSPAIGDIAMNFSANAFGLTNAATPIGIKAMEELQKQNVVPYHNTLRIFLMSSPTKISPKSPIHFICHIQTPAIHLKFPNPITA